LIDTLATQKKSNGQYRARLNASGYEHIDGVRYDSTCISSPVTNDATVMILLVLSLIFGWTAELIGVKGAFLHENFKKEGNVYMDVSEGFEQYYPLGWLLILLQTIYGLKQAEKSFFVEAENALEDMDYDQSKAAYCLYFSWTVVGLILWIAWVDDCVVLGEVTGVKAAKEQMKSGFDCDHLGELTEYVWRKIERTEKYIRFTQPVLLQSYQDKLQIERERPMRTPIETGKVLVKRADETELMDMEQTKY
jgi:hypothetical protein